jgi:hypothetical protein
MLRRIKMGFPGENKLTLKKEMSNTWLIQRLQKPAKWTIETKKDNPFSFGGGLHNGGLSDKAMDLIRGIFQFDYMGSAEFEFGAVPTALQFLAEQASRNNLTFGVIDKTIYYLCPKEYDVYVEDIIKQLRKDEYKLRLKEHCGLKDYFEDKSEYAKRNVGWLELDNGFMFFVDKAMWEKTCQLFGVLPSTN